MLRRLWADDGVRAVTVGRRGCRVFWDMQSAPPAIAEAADAPVLVLAGRTPASGGDMDDNIRLAERGIAAARAWRAAHVFVFSSAAVYGPTGDAAARESTPADPPSAYGAAKLRMERETAAPDVTALRLCNVAGASEPFLSIRAARGRGTLDRFQDGEGPSRSFIGPATLACVLRRLSAHAAAGETLPPILNVAAPPPVAMAAIFAAAGHPFDWRPASASAVQRLHLDTTLLQSICPMEPADAISLWAEAERAKAA